MFTTYDKKNPLFLKYCRDLQYFLPGDIVFSSYILSLFVFFTAFCMKISLAVEMFVISFISIVIYIILDKFASCEYYTNALNELKEIINNDNILKNQGFTIGKKGDIMLPDKWELFYLSPGTFVIIDTYNILRYVYNNNFYCNILHLYDYTLLESDKTVVYKKSYNSNTKYIFDFGNLNITIDLKKEKMSYEENKKNIIKCIQNIKESIEKYRTKLIKICEETLKNNFRKYAEKYQNIEELSVILKEENLINGFFYVRDKCEKVSKIFEEEDLLTSIFFYKKDDNIIYTQLFNEILADLGLEKKITPEKHIQKTHDIKIILSQIYNNVIIQLIYKKLDEIKDKSIKPILDELEK